MTNVIVHIYSLKKTTQKHVGVVEYRTSLRSITGGEIRQAFDGWTGKHGVEKPWTRFVLVATAPSTGEMRRFDGWVDERADAHVRAL